MTYFCMIFKWLSNDLDLVKYRKYSDSCKQVVCCCQTFCVDAKVKEEVWLLQLSDGANLQTDGFRWFSRNFNKRREKVASVNLKLQQFFINLRQTQGKVLLSSAQTLVKNFLAEKYQKVAFFVLVSNCWIRFVIFANIWFQECF